MVGKWFNGGRMGDKKNYVINYLHGFIWVLVLGGEGVKLREKDENNKS